MIVATPSSPLSAVSLDIPFTLADFAPFLETLLLFSLLLKPELSVESECLRLFVFFLVFLASYLEKQRIVRTRGE